MKACIITLKDNSYLKGSFSEKIKGIFSFNYINISVKPCVGEDILLYAKDKKSDSRKFTALAQIKYIINQPKNLKISHDLPNFFREDVDFYIFIIGDNEICNLETNISF